MSTLCPYCGEDIEMAIHHAWVGDYWTFNDEFQCPMCGKEISIDVESEPVFLAHKKTP